MLAFSSLLGNVEGQNIYRIWYDKPASYWEEALPVGNGRIAAMVFGDPQLEQIQLNEETVSAGSPYQNYNEEAKTAYAIVATGEMAVYANVMLQKGVVKD